MKNESKQTLISLSLAGAIGYYLYNKFVQAGVRPELAANEYESAAERTKRELSWRPEPEVEEPEFIMEEEVVETPAEDVVADPVLDLEEETVAEPDVQDVVENDAPVVDEFDIVPPALDLGSLNLEIPEVAEVPVEEPIAEEPIVEDPVSEEPVVEEPAVEEPAVEDPAVEELAVDLILEEVVPESDPELESIDLAELDDEEDETSVEDLFDAVKEEEEAVKTMDNVEPLHKVDGKDQSAKDEFKSIMDFFNTL